MEGRNMLVLTRKPGEAVRIGMNLVITIKEIRGKQVRLGIEAPPSIPVYREEIYESVMQSNREALAPEQLSGELQDLLGIIPSKKKQKNQEEQEVKE